MPMNAFMFAWDQKNRGNPGGNFGDTVILGTRTKIVGIGDNSHLLRDTQVGYD